MAATPIWTAHCPDIDDPRSLRHGRIEPERLPHPVRPLQPAAVAEQFLTMRYALALDLVDDAQGIAEYERAHAKM
jgi:hypothetical protein